MNMKICFRKAVLGIALVTGLMFGSHSDAFAIVLYKPPADVVIESGTAWTVFTPGGATSVPADDLPPTKALPGPGKKYCVLCIVSVDIEGTGIGFDKDKKCFVRKDDKCEGTVTVHYEYRLPQGLGDDVVKDKQ